MTSPMKVEFDPGGMETMMEMWRNAPELNAPDSDEFNFKRIETKLALLKNYQSNAAGWNFLLLCMKPIGADQVPMKLLMQQVAAFEAWAKEEIASLEILRDELKFLYQDKK
ncbi:MAG: hypothetical protein HYS18_17005 [Burkholderiales bacterium]|nr:hypothetical protein [Burkholderiales bacterium]